MNVKKHMFKNTGRDGNPKPVRVRFEVVSFLRCIRIIIYCGFHDSRSFVESVVLSIAVKILPPEPAACERSLSNKPFPTGHDKNIVII